MCDRYSVHRKAVRLLREAGVNWIAVEWLPAYPPDLNPVEAVWNHTKHADLANLIPDDVDHLFDEVLDSLDDLALNTRLTLLLPVGTALIGTLMNCSANWQDSISAPSSRTQPKAVRRDITAMSDRDILGWWPEHRGREPMDTRRVGQPLTHADAAESGQG